MQLPAPLEPWRAWLGLIAPELVDALGQILLQLHPLLGKMRMGSPRRDDLPVGAGNIVRRGAYERMLASEWLYADKLPDEFMRRAANNELLFIGPEPERSRRSRLCVALFDTGPMQLGEPRLAHLALFILLARRAEEAGAEFRWGVLHEPGKLRVTEGKAAVLELIALRTLEPATSAHAAAWDDCLAQQQDLGDCWQVGDNAPRLAGLRGAHMAIIPDLLGGALAVRVTQSGGSRTLSLALPAPDTCVRLMRHPFRTHVVPAGPQAAPTASPQLKHIKPTLKQPPIFSASGDWLAYQAREGATVIHRLGQEGAVKKTRPRYQHPPRAGHLLGAALFDKSMGQLVSVEGSLRFNGFAGRFFHSNSQCARPPAEQFRVPPGLGRLLPLFHLSDKTLVRERVVALTPEGQLVCWTRAAGAGQEPVFSLVSTGVIGAAQRQQSVMFIQCVNSEIHLYEWACGQEVPSHLSSFKGVARRAIVGPSSFGVNRHGASMALQTGESEWQVHGTGPAAPWTVTVPKGAAVIGLGQEASGKPVGLVILSADRKTVAVLGEGGRKNLFNDGRPLAQACIDASGGRLCILTQDGARLQVIRLDGGALLLDLDFKETGDV